MHHRFKPKEYRFEHKVFMFYLDLDELDELSEKFRWMSRNRFNLYSFRDSDHLSGSGKSVKENIGGYFDAQNISRPKGRTMLLTNLRVLGYVFNPVSFYFFSDEAGEPAGALAEVGNTFGEMKPYLLRAAEYQEGAYLAKRPKNFYISPFTALDATLDFHLKIPGESLFVRVDDLDQAGERFFISTFKGVRRPLSDSELLAAFFRHPMMTLKVIGLIHWHALKLYLKKVPYYQKQNAEDLEQNAFRHSRRS